MAKILELLSGGDRRNSGASEEVVALVVEDHSRFPELVDALSVEDDLVRLRAANVLEKVSRQVPELLPSYRELLKKLAVSPEMEVRWYMAQLMPQLKLEGDNRAEAVGLLFAYLDDESALVRVSALSSLAEFSKGDDELRARFLPVLEDLAESGSPAVRTRCRKLLKSLSRDD